MQWIEQAFFTEMVLRKFFWRQFGCQASYGSDSYQVHMTLPCVFTMDLLNSVTDRELSAGMASTHMIGQS